MCAKRPVPNRMHAARHPPTSGLHAPTSAPDPAGKLEAFAANARIVHIDIDPAGARPDCAYISSFLYSCFTESERGLRLWPPAAISWQAGPAGRGGAKGMFCRAGRASPL